MKKRYKVTIAAFISLLILLFVGITAGKYSFARSNSKSIKSSDSDAVSIEDNGEVVEVANEDLVAEGDTTLENEAVTEMIVTTEKSTTELEASINMDEKNAVGSPMKEKDSAKDKEVIAKEDSKKDSKKNGSKKQDTLNLPDRDNLPKIVSIDMENINQYPELPTGCESVATTMLLNYYGFNLDKTTFAEKYLIYADNFVTGYSGDPHSYGGGGCYAPGLVKSTNEFLKDKNSDLTACNVTGSKPEELYWYVACDMPVVVWDTVSMLENQPSGSYYEYRGRKYQWDRCEHCVVLCGYDLTNNTVLINDPIDGLIERDAERFWRYYENLGSMAMILY